MKQSMCIFIACIFLLAACSPNGASYECMNGICVRLEITGSVQSLEPVPFILSIKTNNDISHLGISVSGDANITISVIEKYPEGAELAYQDERSRDWWLDTKGGQEYFFTGYVIFPEPSASYGVFHWGLIASAGTPTSIRVTDSVLIYLDATGKQVDENRARELETNWYPPTPPLDLTIVPETPLPTAYFPPTETNVPTPTPTLNAYPAPDDYTENGTGTKNEPSPLSTAYPNP